MISKKFIKEIECVFLRYNVLMFEIILVWLVIFFCFYWYGVLFNLGKKIEKKRKIINRKVRLIVLDLGGMVILY